MRRALHAAVAPAFAAVVFAACGGGDRAASGPAVSPVFPMARTAEAVAPSGSGGEARDGAKILASDPADRTEASGPPLQPPPGHGEAVEHGESTEVTMGVPSGAGATASAAEAGLVWSRATLSGSGTAAAGRQVPAFAAAAPDGAAASNADAATTLQTLPGAEARFVARAAEHGEFEVTLARVAAEKAVDPLVKAYAQMLLDDHRAANRQLRQIADSHGLALPALSPEQRAQVDAITQLSGAEFDRRFVEAVGIEDHRQDIQAFEKAAQEAQNPQVRAFAQSALPTLKKHLTTAQQLPAAKVKG